MYEIVPRFAIRDSTIGLLTVTGALSGGFYIERSGAVPESGCRCAISLSEGSLGPFDISNGNMKLTPG